VKGGNEAHFVPANIEDGELADDVGTRECFA
jgi:hypothetical protein